MRGRFGPWRKLPPYYKKKEAANYPWVKTWRIIEHRVKFNPLYIRKEIKNLITLLELKELWRRDKGHLLKEPSIDRKNSNKHYTFKNCRYIELVKNKSLGSLGNTNTKGKKIHTKASKLKISIAVKNRWKIPGVKEHFIKIRTGLKMPRKVK